MSTVAPVRIHSSRQSRTLIEFDLPGSPGISWGNVISGLSASQMLAARVFGSFEPSQDSQPKLPRPSFPAVKRYVLPGW